MMSAWKLCLLVFHLQPLYNASVAFAQTHNMVRALELMIEAEKTSGEKLTKEIKQAFDYINSDANVSELMKM